MKEKLIRFFKQETVLCAAFALAIVSMLFVHPDKEYIGYVDFRTLAILFCLMSVMAGLQKSGVFQCVAQALLVREDGGNGGAFHKILSISCRILVCPENTHLL